jgi:hypothetical protein
VQAEKILALFSDRARVEAAPVHDLMAQLVRN